MLPILFRNPYLFSMPSAIGHMILASSFTPFRPFKERLLQTLLLAIISSAIPDLDVIGFSIGIHYGDMLGHRGFTHSILFALLWAALLYFCFYREEYKDTSTVFFIIYFFFCCTISHGLLDACTDGGKGVGFFIPFSSERYFFPMRPIAVAPLSISAFFTAYGWEIFKSELRFIGPISACLLLAGIIWRRKFVEKP